MSRIFLTSDTHWGHWRILEYEAVNRPFHDITEHDEYLIARWNERVNDADTVWHLGDVFFKKENAHLLHRLKGKKRLILGNHDHYDLSVYTPFFEKILGCATLHDCVLTHIPIHPSQFFRFKANIHGHLHSHTIDDPRYVNVCVEHWGLAPVLLDDVFKKLQKQLPDIDLVF